jgi:ubiquinone/menaquinone biosynthesis C-methylase UbiE
MDDWRSYDEVAETYERVHAPRLAEPAHDLVALAAPPPGGRVLDVGTGTGVAAQAGEAAVDDSGLTIGIDASLRMLAIGHRARPKLRFAAASAIDLPFRDGTFDVVTANFVISHFTKYQTALYDMIRVLRPGGRLAVSSWSDKRDELQRTWGEMVETVVPREMLQPVWAAAAPWHERFTDRAKLEEALLDAGLRHVRTEPREYHFRYSLEEYVSGLEIWATGRFVRGMLGEERWEDFRADVRSVFAERFPDPLNDYRDVWLAVGTKP